MGRKRLNPGRLEDVYVSEGRRLTLVGARAGMEDAADVVQESFAKALAADKARPIRDPLHFMFRVVRNTALSRLRDRARHPVRGFAAQEDFASSDPSVERALLASERLRRALAIIERMPERRREAFVMHRVEELSYPQIARRMGVSIKAVEKHISLAMAQLHREIEDEA